MNRIFCNFLVIGHKFGLRNLHTGVIVCARVPKKDPGISRRAQIFKDDVEFIESLEDEEDIAGLESDFSQADGSYLQDKR